VDCSRLAHAPRVWRLQELLQLPQIRGGVADRWRRRDVMATSLAVRAVLVSLLSVYFHLLSVHVRLSADAAGHCRQVQYTIRHSSFAQVCHLGQVTLTDSYGLSPVSRGKC